MIVYEVNLAVESSATEAVGEWLPGHIEEILALPGFRAAQWLEVLDGPEDARTHWSIRYVLNDEEDLQHYIERHAERMRADGLARFGGSFTASRRVLRPLRQFDSMRPAAP